MTCHPANASQDTTCAKQILSTLARRAYRRPVTEQDTESLMGFYQRGRNAGGNFDHGVELAIQAILMDPDFIFRKEVEPADGRRARNIASPMSSWPIVCPHRGRLNILAHNLGRPYDTIFAEFEGTSTLEPITTIPQGGTGDVKYHHGAQGSYQLSSDESMMVRLESNPSHLEYVDPVAAGATRAPRPPATGPTPTATRTRRSRSCCTATPRSPARAWSPRRSICQAAGWLHARRHAAHHPNNQLGFTTEPTSSAARRCMQRPGQGLRHTRSFTSTPTMSRACIAAVRLAFAFRQEFGHDVLIDLIGYRRFGHNEADEPAYTQPEMYQVIKRHAPVRELFAHQLVDRGIVTEQESTEMTDAVWAVLSEDHQHLKEQIAAAKELEHATGEYELDRTASPEVKTAVSAERLHVLNEELLSVPTASRSIRSSSSSSSSAARRLTSPTVRSSGRTPRRSRSPRC